MSVYLTAHFMAVLAYASPDALTGKLKHYVFPYMYPYFHQSWSLFVPVPKENFNVYVKIDSGKWEDVFQKIVQDHQTNRLVGNENIMIAFSNSLRYYVSSVSDKSMIMPDDGSNINFVVLKKIIKQYYHVKANTEIRNMDVIVITRSITAGKEYAHYYKIRN